MPPADVPPLGQLQAPAAWRSAEFISDLHLQAAELATFQACQRYLAGSAADAIFILGDLFEAWPGDDAAEVPGFAAECAAMLRDAAQRRPVFFMHGNRDFLVGPALMQATGLTLLADPTLLHFAGRRWLLSHGDALCLEDREYLQFRAQVREPDWQRSFLAQPLARRQAVAQALRAESEARKQGGMAAYADVDTLAALAWLDAADAAVLVHGHTHRPGDHLLRARPPRMRVVLSDWDATAQPPRLQALRISADGGMARVALA